MSECTSKWTPGPGDHVRFTHYSGWTRCGMLLAQTDRIGYDYKVLLDNGDVMLCFKAELSRGDAL